MDDITKGKVIAQIGNVRRLHVTLGHALDDLDALLAEQPTAGQEAKRFLDAYVGLWKRTHHGQTYVVSGPKEMAVCKRLVKAVPFDDLLMRAGKFLNAPDAFYRDAKHPLALFASVVNKFSDRTNGHDSADFLTAPVSDCHHAPRCRSDQQHTALRLREARA